MARPRPGGEGRAEEHYVPIVDRAFRFGYQLSVEDERDPVSAARHAERAGFDVVLVGDHVGPGVSPIIALAAIARETEAIRLGTLVLNFDMRNPVQLAWEASTLDRLSRGRFELGIGAGHTPQEYTATGIAFDRPRVRKERLMEGVETLRRLLDGNTVTYHGNYIDIEEAMVDRAYQSRMPLLVGGNGAALLAHAGAHADIIGLQGLGRTLPDGQAHEPKWDPAWLDAQIEQVRKGAGERFADLELNALVQVCRITEDTQSFVAEACERIEGLLPEHAAATPYLLFGSVDDIARKLHECRDRWGISYFVVRERRSFADVISALR